ncbi:MAG: putative quinol monooxygenase [Chloroflexota bacterium]
MWGQIVKVRIKPGTEAELMQIQEEMKEDSSADSGWVRTITGRNNRDPLEHYTLVTFQSEADARRREASPQSQEFGARLQACMDGQPEFIDLDIVFDSSA